MTRLFNTIALALAAIGFSSHASETVKDLGSNPAVKSGQEDNYEDRSVEAAFKNLSNSRFQKSNPGLTHHAFDKN